MGRDVKPGQRLEVEAEVEAKVEAKFIQAAQNI